jgi:hypothetical protein
VAESRPPTVPRNRRPLLQPVGGRRRRPPAGPLWAGGHPEAAGPEAARKKPGGRPSAPDLRPVFRPAVSSRSSSRRRNGAGEVFTGGTEFVTGQVLRRP